MKTLIIIPIIFLLTSCETILTDEKTIEKQIKVIAEKSYFQGQKDALNGDVKIKLNKDSIYIWTDSPWDNNSEPTYIPTYIDSKNTKN